MDKLTLKEITDYAKDVIELTNKVYTVKGIDTINTEKASELKCILYNDWCKRFESLNLAKFALKAILADKDEWCRDDEIFLKDILEEHPMKDDTIYDLEATMLAILKYVDDDLEY